MSVLEKKLNELCNLLSALNLLAIVLAISGKNLGKKIQYENI